MKEYTRLESDSIGEMEIPENAYYGVQSLRARENFPITGAKLHPVFIKNLARIKRAAAITNRAIEMLCGKKAITPLFIQMITSIWPSPPTMSYQLPVN